MATTTATTTTTARKRRGSTPQALNTTAIALIALGFVVIFMAWFGAASVDFTQGQIPYLISGGLTGVVLAVGGINLLRVHEARKDTERIIAKLDQIASALASAGAAGTWTGAGDPSAPRGDEVVAGNESYHRPDCRVVASRSGQAPRMAPQAAEARGLTPCRVCNPAFETA